MTPLEFKESVEAIAEQEFASPTGRMGDEIESLTQAFADQGLPQSLIDDLNDWQNLYGGSDFIDLIKWIWGKVKDAARWLWDQIF